MSSLGFWPLGARVREQTAVADGAAGVGALSGDEGATRLGTGAGGSGTPALRRRRHGTGRYHRRLRADKARPMGKGKGPNLILMLI